MKDTLLRDLRNEDLYKSYVKALGERQFSSMVEAVGYARKMPAKRFYIEGCTAAPIIQMIRDRISLVNLHPNSRKRIWRLYDDYCQYTSRNGSGKSLSSVMDILVNRPAPEFYLSDERARHIILDQRKAAKKRKGLA